MQEQLYIYHQGDFAFNGDKHTKLQWGFSHEIKSQIQRNYVAVLFRVGNVFNIYIYVSRLNF